MKKRIVLVLIIICMLVSVCGCQRSNIEFNYFTGRFNPYTVRGVQDLSVVNMVFEPLIVTTGDNDIATVYDAYSKGLGIADITTAIENEKTVCTIKIGNDIYFSDGVQLTAKDVEFSMYVYADIDYNGWSDFGKSFVEGIKEYQYKSSEVGAIEITDEQINTELENPSEITKERIRKNIIIPVLSDEYAWIASIYKDPAFVGTEAQIHTEKYPTASELFAFYYSVDKSYTGKGDSKEQAIETVAAQYGVDYKLLGDVYGTDMSDLAKEIAVRTLTEKALEGKSKDVNSISGIKVIDEFTLEVTINSVISDEIESSLNIYVGPSHYYGGENAQSGGFEVDFDVIDQKSESPIGSGRYVLKSYTDGKSVVFIKNDNYHREIELENTITFHETGNSVSMSESGYLMSYDMISYVKE